MKESSFQFSNPTLDEIYFYINKDFDVTQFQGLDIKSNTEVSISPEDFKANVSLEINIGNKDIKYPFKIKCIFSSDFNWTADTEYTNELLEKNAPAVLLSYARPYISMITAGSKYPPFNLPFMNFQDNKEDDTK